jgi:hypothetical protein
MAKRKQRSPYKETKKDIVLPKEDPLKGLQERSDKADRLLISRMIEPEERILNLQFGKDEEGKNMSANVELPHSPYPFKHPATQTKEVDDSVRRLRRDFPGAGTATFSNFVTNPNMRDALRFAKDDETRDRMLRGLQSTTDTGLWGTAYPGESYDAGDVYIKPGLKGLDLDRTVMHELGHRNIPSSRDGVGYWESDPTKPGHRRYVPAQVDADEAYNRLYGGPIEHMNRPKIRMSTPALKKKR